jgi:hypothetical protein
MANVRRTSLNLDLERVERARVILGTTTTTDTVHAALDEVARQSAISALLAYDGGLYATDDPVEVDPLGDLG